jgi:glycosyltransferase involved in cell wall biosynthesis
MAKGHDLVIEALPSLPEVRLLIVGDGPFRPELEALAGSLGVSDRVRFLGRRPHEELPELYEAADALVLASMREGWPNVLLESMACGTPVIASGVGGIPEVVAAPEAGRILPERTSAAIAATVKSLFAAPPDRAATRAYAEKFSWEATTRGQIRLFQEILARPGPCRTGS